MTITFTAARESGPTTEYSPLRPEDRLSPISPETSSLDRRACLELSLELVRDRREELEPLPTNPRPDC